MANEKRTTVKNKRVWVQLKEALRHIEIQLKPTKNFSGEEFQLIIGKSHSLVEIYDFINLYPLWSQQKRADEKFNLWLKKKKAKMTKEAIRVSNHRVNKEILGKIGSSTIEDIVSSTSIEALKSVMEKFRKSSGIRLLKRSYLIDLLMFCRRQSTKQSDMYMINLFSSMAASEDVIPLEVLFDLFHVNQNRLSGDYGKEDRFKIIMRSRVLFDLDPKFEAIQDVFSSYYNRQCNFDLVLIAIENTIIYLEEEEE